MTETEETALAIGLGLAVLWLLITPDASSGVVGAGAPGGGAVGSAPSLPSAPAPARVYGVSQAGLVAQALGEADSAGEDMTDLCVISNAVDRAVELIRQSTGWPAGRLSKPDGTQCGGLAVDIIAFPNGEIYDVVIGKGSINGPAWDADANIDPSRYVG
jgi:hypothetical protein